jgi:hypothetical protein
MFGIGSNFDELKEFNIQLLAGISDQESSRPTDKGEKRVRAEKGDNNHDDEGTTASATEEKQKDATLESDEVKADGRDDDEHRKEHENTKKQKTAD